ncbi:DUF4232 domain-containing protein [Streptomyces sp. NBC_01142]|uniref:DUF4232 domain-containing protein n=1 Tax=Streptomyces sp. NBC_01142 TaxID=2975865 RepID=UPI002253A303|nr:DUF4232 domain-containing protein [Streptomyces sp. NBC_01142]MCX4822251.1 DUF4232 domain-containing protein [Streptomyces sp. NBC_01142]
MAGVVAGVLSGCGSTTVEEAAAEPVAPRELGVKPDPLTASPGSHPGAQPSPTASPVPAACPASGVVVTNDVVNAAMGHRAVTITLTNCGKRPYQVNGYPQVGALDKDRKPLKLKITHGNAFTDAGRDQRPKPVTLAPGQSVLSVLHWTNRVTSFDAAKPGEYLVVAPAAGREQQILPFTLDMGTAAELDVTAWAVRLAS